VPVQKHVHVPMVTKVPRTVEVEQAGSPSLVTGVTGGCHEGKGVYPWVNHGLVVMLINWLHMDIICETTGYTYSHPQIDGKVNHHQISRDLLFHLFGDDYITYDQSWL